MKKLKGGQGGEKGSSKHGDSSQVDFDDLGGEKDSNLRVSMLSSSDDANSFSVRGTDFRIRPTFTITSQATLTRPSRKQF